MRVKYSTEGQGINVNIENNLSGKITATQIKDNIENFFAEHKVSWVAGGFGYSALKVDNETLSIPLSGVDITMLGDFVWEKFHVDVTGDHSQ